MIPHYIIAVSEGRFRVLERFARPGQLAPTLREVASHDYIPLGGGGAHGGRGAEHGGGFPFPTGGVRAMRAVDEPEPLQEHERRRAVDWLTDQIENFLLARPGQPWAFAAAPNLLHPVLDRLRPSVRGSMVESVERNLVLATPSDLAMHFKVRS